MNRAVAMPPKSILLDTNFLLVPFQFRINILSELRYLVPVSHRFVICQKTIGELRSLAEKVGKDAMAARLAMKMVAANPIEIVKNTLIEKNDEKDNEKVDDWIVTYASQNNSIVCTNDAPLRRRLKRLKIRVVTLKSRSKLGFV